MIIKQFIIGFILRHIETYKNILLYDNNSNTNVNLHTSPLHNTLDINYNMFKKIIDLNKQTIDDLKSSGYDGRNHSENHNDNNNETTIDMLYEYYIKLALLQLLEKDTIPQVEKLRLIREYEKNSNHSKPSKFTNNIWKGLSVEDF